MTFDLMREEDTVNRFIDFIEQAASKDTSGMMSPELVKDLLIALKAMKIAFIASTAMESMLNEEGK